MTRYAILYTPPAARMIRKLTPETRELCRTAIEYLAEHPHEGKLLKPPFRSLRSFRTSAYRIIYKVEERKITIVVIAVGHRRDIYEKLRRLLLG